MACSSAPRAARAGRRACVRFRRVEKAVSLNDDEQIDFSSRSPSLSLVASSSCSNSTASFLAETGAPQAPRRPPRALLFAPFSSENAKTARRAENSREREFDRDALGHSRGRRNGNPRIAFFSSSRQRLPSGAACPPPVFAPSLSPQAPPLSLSPLSPPNSIRVHAERRVGRGRGMRSSSDGEDGARMGGGGGRRRRGNRGKHGRQRRHLRSVSRGAQPAL